MTMPLGSEKTFDKIHHSFLKKKKPLNYWRVEVKFVNQIKGTHVKWKATWYLIFKN